MNLDRIRHKVGGFYIESNNAFLSYKPFIPGNRRAYDPQKWVIKTTAAIIQDELVLWPLERRSVRSYRDQNTSKVTSTILQRPPRQEINGRCRPYQGEGKDGPLRGLPFMSRRHIRQPENGWSH